MPAIHEGDRVRWKWGSDYAEGTVKSSFEKRVTRTIKGSEIVRNGSSDNPALYIEQDDGDHVLKLSSEVDKVN
ncbi:DUF2945 domain-containing protein [Persicimonas caeni]|uniref:DUF2945 domain-containing protein n=1 Tax=Persicimonas caeni TaxID=2292766 RepID=A0A4Y6Q0Z8_PERCE|nr:DUF2945 domain-containing protein [Persicimonas caeni]QDG54251.1 DUF2945 domain-containing protein [Persicimonas caeni]QED35472.1 DUF2945 domain-containing protein [Persicimonas caeni]